jgi:hypothetical protein
VLSPRALSDLPLPNWLWAAFSSWFRRRWLGVMCFDIAFLRFLLADAFTNRPDFLWFRRRKILFSNAFRDLK